MELKRILENARTTDVVFRELYDGTVNKVYAYALNRTRDKAQAMDIVQNAYAALWQSLDRFRYVSDEHFWGYFFTIIRRVLAREWRRKKEESLSESYDVVAPDEEHEDYRVLLGAVEDLKEKEQQVIKLRYFSDFSFADIAAALSITEGNAKVIHHRAFEKLKALIEQLYV